MSTKAEPLLTVSDLEALPDDGNKYELFEGELFVSRAPTLSHQRTLGNVYAILRAYLDKNPIGEVILNPGVIFDRFNSAIPDAIFVTIEQFSTIGSEDHITQAPALAIEVLSTGAGNARRDREVKRQVYGKHGVKEYWIIDPQQRSFEIYRLEGNALKLSQTLINDDEVLTPVLPGFTCRIGEIFASR
ncbi:MAG TPA: Uma2 family endonuclease [Pyrinomonadaceae bacterium]|nr:Uma2 family endonuclease [Pyrinomonadaceae bacterium]